MAVSVISSGRRNPQLVTVAPCREVAVSKWLTLRPFLCRLLSVERCHKYLKRSFVCLERACHKDPYMCVFCPLVMDNDDSYYINCQSSYAYFINVHECG